MRNRDYTANLNLADAIGIVGTGFAIYNGWYLLAIACGIITCVCWSSNVSRK